MSGDSTMEKNQQTMPQACVTMPWFECRPGIFEIDEFDCGSVFVVVGRERALLLDTGTGIGDLKWLVEHKITDKPYDVVLSHNHGDHLGGAGWFPEIWMHPADASWKDLPTTPSLDFRRNYAQMICRREGKHYAYNLQADIRPWPGEPMVRPLEDGHCFDLGGRVVTAYHCPGHTPGEMVFIDSLTGTLLCGDACNCNWLLYGGLASTPRGSLELAAAALKRIATKAGREYDVESVFNFHHDYRGFGQALKPRILPDLIFCMESVLRGTASFQEVPDPLSDTGGRKIVAWYEDVRVSCMGDNISGI